MAGAFPVRSVVEASGQRKPRATGSLRQVFGALSEVGSGQTDWSAPLPRPFTQSDQMTSGRMTPATRITISLLTPAPIRSALKACAGRIRFMTSCCLATGTGLMRCRARARPFSSTIGANHGTRRKAASLLRQCIYGGYWHAGHHVREFSCVRCNRVRQRLPTQRERRLHPGQWRVQNRCSYP